MSTIDSEPTTTGVYKLVGPSKHAVAFDLYLPSTLITAPNDLLILPTVVYFHPGGLIAGDKRWLPKWLHGEWHQTLLPDLCYHESSDMGSAWVWD